ncbi:hypothetical protein ACQEVM_36775 [Streptomyces sp. CA-243310]|uniref:hypothetical protein n=1 Tax=Streptomyces sp. CA-243310 TaxID=3240056 RepID=UPI003D8B36B7
MPLGMWLRPAFPEPEPPVPASGRLPDGVPRDDVDPPAPHPRRLFRAGPGTFQHTLVRLPAVRGPLLRATLDNLAQHMHAGIL